MIAGVCIPLSTHLRCGVPGAGPGAGTKVRMSRGRVAGPDPVRCARRVPPGLSLRPRSGKGPPYSLLLICTDPPLRQRGGIQPRLGSSPARIRKRTSRAYEARVRKARKLAKDGVRGATALGGRLAGDQEFRPSSSGCPEHSKALREQQVPFWLSRRVLATPS